MAKNFDLLDCEDDDVIAFGDDTYKIGRLRKEVNNLSNQSMGQEVTQRLEKQGIKISPEFFTIRNPPSPYNTTFQGHERWFSRGMDCEILQLGAKKWKKVKVKIKIALEIYAEQEEMEENTSTSNPEINPPELPVEPLEELRRQVINLQNK